jgi:hypothetical protein
VVVVCHSISGQKTTLYRLGNQLTLAKFGIFFSVGYELIGINATMDLMQSKKNQKRNSTMPEVILQHFMLIFYKYIM